MAESVPAFNRNQAPVTMTASAGVTGGQLVALTGGRRVAPAGAGSTAVIGVAENDAAAEANVPVGMSGVYRLTASGAIAAGATCVAGAAGTVATAAGPATGAYVGKALEAIADGETGLVAVNIG